MIFFTFVTVKFLYTIVELNLPHHLNYVATLPCKCTQRIVHVKLQVYRYNICCNFGNCCLILIIFCVSDIKYLRPSVE